MEADEYNSWTFEVHFDTFSVFQTVWGILYYPCYACFAVVNDDVWLLTFYNNINALILFMPLILVTGELPVIASFQDLFTFHFILLMTLGGLFGFAIGYVTGMQVKVSLGGQSRH